VLISEKLKGNASFYAPYLNILPKEFSNLALWSPQELDELQENIAIEEIANEKYWSNKHYEEMKTLLEKASLSTEGFTYDLFAWAELVGGTRCFQVNETWPYALGTSHLLRIH
jgi:hypothetical protein